MEKMARPIETVIVSMQSLKVVQLKISEWDEGTRTSHNKIYKK